MAEQTLIDRIERALEAANLHVAVERSGDAITLSGKVGSAEQRQAAEDIVRGIDPSARVDNDLTVYMTLPEDYDDRISDDPSPANLPDSVQEINDLGATIEPDFTDQPILENPEAAVGPSGSADDDPASDGDEVYVPPVDPVTRLDQDGQPQVVGGFELSSMDDVEVPRSSDGRLGDEAIAEAIREELLQDASTTDLELAVDVRQGIVHLRGAVQTLDDAENAEAVARRVPGVEDVVDETTVESLG